MRQKIENPKLKELGIKDEERQSCEVWSRVMGYHRSVSGFNVGKKQEFYDRKYFKMPEGEVPNESI